MYISAMILNHFIIWELYNADYLNEAHFAFIPLFCGDAGSSLISFLSLLADYYSLAIIK